MIDEQLASKKEFDLKIPREVEKKFIPLFMDTIAKYRQESMPIEQFYLSHPAEPFSLRLRDSFTPQGERIHEATLKDTGTVTDSGLDRLEVTCPITQELYEFYKSAETPVLRKLRSEPLPGVVIDYYDDGTVQLESENAQSWKQFIATHGDMFIEITGDHASSNEWKAHLNYRPNNEGSEALKPAAELDVDAIVAEILNHQLPYTPTVVHIGGRSGSGKSTLVTELRNKLASSWAGLDSLVISTDDYHRGTAWLLNYNGGEIWTKWDAPIVYDTHTMAQDIATLINRRSIPKREIDWSIAEPVVTGTHEPASVIIIEGIYAMSPEITHADDLQYEMPTGLATCIGRRLLRDLKERPEFADPQKSLQYMLTEAEPAYREQRART